VARAPVHPRSPERLGADGIAYAVVASRAPAARHRVCADCVIWASASNVGRCALYCSSFGPWLQGAGKGGALVVRRLRYTWPDEDRPNDFQVWEGSVAIGRMYEIDTPIGIQWRWSVSGLVVKDFPPAGAADSRGAAQAAFKAAWAGCEKNP
jgi:hypothetical protein